MYYISLCEYIILIHIIFKIFIILLLDFFKTTIYKNKINLIGIKYLFINKLIQKKLIVKYLKKNHLKYKQ